MNTTRTAALGTTALGAALALALLPAASASAHVTAEASSTAAGSHSVITFSIPHGCDGAPTIAVDIEIPEPIRSVTPTVKPGWSIEKNIVDDRVASVTYTAIGDGLADGYRDTFELALQLPASEAGEAVEFPTVQTCPEGATAEWVGDKVPTVILSEAEEGGGHGHGPAEHTDAAEASPAPARAEKHEDMVARIIAVSGVLVGIIGLVVGVGARRTQEKGTK